MSNEKRKSSRKVITADGYIYGVDSQAIGPCQVRDVSRGGAKILHSLSVDFPREFLLLLSRDGRVRRRCNTVWQTQGQIGVRFVATKSV
jgi:hypothetical protein